MDETISVKKQKDLDHQIKRLMLTMMISLMDFLLAYFTVYLFLQLFTLIAAGIAGISGKLYYNEICFDPGIRWTVKKIIFVSGSGPVLMLLSGIFLVLLVRKLLHGNSPCLRIFLLWAAFHCFNFFTGGILAGTVTGTGFGYALDYALLRPWILYLFMDLLCAAALAGFGYRNARLWLATSPTPFWTREEYREKYFIFSATIPWLTGSLILLALKIPGQELQHGKIFLHDIILLLTLGFIIAGMIMNRRHFTVHSRLHRGENDGRVLKWLSILCLLLLLLHRFLLTGSFYSLFGQ